MKERRAKEERHKKTRAKSNQLRRAFVRPQQQLHGTVRTRNDEEIGGETKKQKIRCLNPCNSDSRDIAGKLVENYRAFEVTSYQHPRETRQALKVHQHGDMKNFIDVE